MDRSIYDTKEGIAAQLGSYDDLYALFLARREAGYDRRERMNEFVILGRLRADQLGNWRKLNREIFTEEVRQKMPPVMTDAEFGAFVDQLQLEEFTTISEGVEGPSLGQPPPPRIKCVLCGNGWTLENCHDYDDRGEFGQLELDNHVGKTLSQIQGELDGRDDAVYFVITSVQNLDWMVLSPDASSAELNGWRDKYSDNPITLDYVVGPGDRGKTWVYHYYHGSCFRQKQEEERVEGLAETVRLIQRMLGDAGFDAVVVKEAPLPDHLREWMLQDEPDLDQEKMGGLAKETPYLRVETAQGAFGFWLMENPLIDLKETGIAPVELIPEMADAPSDFPPICEFDGDPAFLLKLWQLMTKRQSSRK